MDSAALLQVISKIFALKCRYLPPPEQKTTIVLPLNTTIKQGDSLFGLYCINFAWNLFHNTPKVTTDFELYQMFSNLR